MYLNAFLLSPFSFQGVGDSAQGFANFLLFCCFTKRVRNLCLSTLPFKGRKVKPHSTAAGKLTPADRPPPETNPRQSPSANQTISEDKAGRHRNIEVGV